MVKTYWKENKSKNCKIENIAWRFKKYATVCRHPCNRDKNTIYVHYKRNMEHVKIALTPAYLCSQLLILACFFLTLLYKTLYIFALFVNLDRKHTTATYLCTISRNDRTRLHGVLQIFQINPCHRSPNWGDEEALMVCLKWATVRRHVALFFFLLFDLICIAHILLYLF